MPSDEDGPVRGAVRDQPQAADDLDGRLALRGAPGVRVDAECSDVVAALRPEALVGVRVDALAVGARRRGGDHAAPQRGTFPSGSSPRAAWHGPGGREVPGDEFQRPEGPAAAAPGLIIEAFALPPHVDVSPGGVKDVELSPVAQGARVCNGHYA